MFFTLMKGMGILYFWTWFIWPYLFVFSFAFGISALIKGEKTAQKHLLVSSFSLLIILSGFSI